MEETTSTATTASDASPSYMQSLIGPAGDLGSTESTEASDQTQTDVATATDTTSAADTTKTATADATAKGTIPTVDELIEQFATETGLNASDPTQRKTLKRLADKELFIRKLQQDNETLKSTGNTNSPELVTEYEQELSTERNGTTAATTDKVVPINQKAADATGTVEAHKYGDIGDDWKTTDDSLKALNDAWTRNDLKAVHDIEVARQLRTFDRQIAPAFLSYIERMVEARLGKFAEKDLGDVLPDIRRSVTDRRVAESRDFAIAQLRKAGAEDIDELFTVQDGPPIKYNGQEFPNTPLNQILVKHPEIMQVMSQHPDATKAERASFIARYKLAYQMHKQGKGGVAVDVAKKLVETGRAAKERETADRTRQSINSGVGTTVAGGEKPSKSYMSQLNSLPGEVPLASLLS